MDSKNTNAAATPAEQELSKIMSQVLDHWKLFVCCIVLCLAGGWLYLKCATPVFKINASVLVEDDKKGGSLFGNASNAVQDFSGLLGTVSNVDNEAQILQTQDLLERVVRDMQLNVTTYEKKNFLYREVYPEIPLRISAANSLTTAEGSTFTVTGKANGKITIDEEIVKTDTSDAVKQTYEAQLGYPVQLHSGVYQFDSSASYQAGKSYRIAVTSIENAMAYLGSLLTVKVPNKQVSTINLELAYPVPAKGKRILNELVKQYVKGNLEQKNAFADSTMAFIDRRIAIVNDDLNQVERLVQDFKQKHKIADMDEQAKVLIHQWEQQGTDINSVSAEMSLVDTLMHMFTSEGTKNRMVPGLLTKDPVFLELLAIYNQNQLLRERLLGSFTPNNPQIKNIDEQLDGLRGKMIDHLAGVKKGLMLSYNQLDSIGTNNNVNINKVPEIQRNYVDLVRQQEIKQALFVFLLQKREEVAVTKASNIASARLIDSPRAELKIISPKKPLAIGLAFVIGVLLPFGALSLKNTLNTKLQTSEEVIKLSQMALVGEINHSDYMSPLIYTEMPDSVIAEQFRALRTNLQFVNGDVKCPVVMLTSSFSGEGKSFTAVNLAQAFASTGKKVLIMEFDLRRPMLCNYMNLAVPQGFSNYIVSNLPLGEVIISSGVDNLDIFPTGPLPPNPAELLMNAKVAQMFNNLKEKYDMIILDTPPVGLVADAQILAAYANTCLYVVRLGYTYKNRLSIAQELKATGKINNMYLVVNDVKTKTSHRYGYGYGNYKYNQAYGSLNHKSTRKKKKFGSVVNSNN